MRILILAICARACYESISPEHQGRSARSPGPWRGGAKAEEVANQPGICVEGFKRRCSNTSASHAVWNGVTRRRLRHRSHTGTADFACDNSIRIRFVGLNLNLVIPTVSIEGITIAARGHVLVQGGVSRPPRAGLATRDHLTPFKLRGPRVPLPPVLRPLPQRPKPFPRAAPEPSLCSRLSPAELIHAMALPPFMLVFP